MNLILSLLFTMNAWASALVEVPSGSYRPLMAKGKSVNVEKFEMFVTPVTNKEFLEFVQANPKWQKSKAKKLFVDSQYLSQWKSDQEPGPAAPDKAPVVFVSWFAAEAFCEFHGLRLPLVDEWEYVGQAGPVDNKLDVKTVILDWYSKPTPEVMPSVKSIFKNKYGLWDLHGLIWEWTFDFNTTFVTGESRADSSLEKSLYCGSGAVGAADPSDYAAFMRFGFRSSLKANYTVANLGFRCVKGRVK